MQSSRDRVDSESKIGPACALPALPVAASGSAAISSGDAAAGVSLKRVREALCGDFVVEVDVSLVPCAACGDAAQHLCCHLFCRLHCPYVSGNAVSAPAEKKRKTDSCSAGAVAAEVVCSPQSGWIKVHPSRQP